MENEIIVFEKDEIKLNVNLKDDTVWLNRQQLASLFDRDIKTISKHINNVLREELSDDNSTVAKFATTTKHGAIAGKTQTRLTNYYNLDVIISVGYRVKSNKGVAFRKWANKVLKEYLFNGYVVNKERLEYLEKTIKVIDIVNRSQDRLNNDEAKEIFKILGKYTKSLDLLDNYDHKVINETKGSYSDKQITYENCNRIINDLKFNENSSIFAMERNKGLDSIIGAIYQTYDGEDVYKTIQEKAANFIYLVTKNHVYIDGNKRIAATLFIYFLSFYDLLFKDDEFIIDNNALTALTLLIATSDPKEKEIIVNLVMNFLV